MTCSVRGRIDGQPWPAELLGAAAGPGTAGAPRTTTARPGPRPVHLLCRCVGGTKRSGWGDVGMAVDGLPLAILAPVDVGDAQGRRLDRATVHGEGDVLVADGVGQVPTGAGGHQLEAVVAEVGEP